MSDDNTNIEVLLPCPFCGSHAESGNGFMPSESIVLAWCSNTYCELHNNDTGFTPSTWNRRAALSNAEPVGYLLEVDAGKDTACLFVANKVDIGAFPVFLHPSVPAPLSDAKVRAIAVSISWNSNNSGSDLFIEVARAIEMAHGIKKPK